MRTKVIIGVKIESTISNSFYQQKEVQYKGVIVDKMKADTDESKIWVCDLLKNFKEQVEVERLVYALFCANEKDNKESKYITETTEKDFIDKGEWFNYHTDVSVVFLFKDGEWYMSDTHEGNGKLTKI